ncbi:MAG: NAD-glutamate dehydrogenase [Deltaproteobacteria bacterium]|nr:NAD-glutamate dehydrogenase [Deltaproteobacteria bacterium]
MAEFSKAIARLMEERTPVAGDPPALRAVLERMRALLTPIERPLADAFARQLFAKGAIEHLVTGDPQVWAAITVPAFRFFSEPLVSEPRVRVFNPDGARDGWDAAGTVIQTTMRDRPFIVDTIREGVQALGGKLHRVLHPVMGVERDRAGVLLTVGAPEVVGAHESFVHAEIERTSDAASLQAALLLRLEAVVAATDDYPAMRAQLAQHAENLRRRGVPRPWNENLDEVAAFCDWLAQKSFVFLGYREYEFSGQGNERCSAVRAGSGLGILRDEQRSSYMTPRPIPPALRRRLNEPPLLLVSKTNAESPIHRRAHMDYIGLKQIDPAGVVAGEYRFVGLFTAKAYGEESAQLPLLRRQLDTILAREEAVPDSHDYRAITELFNTIPKEELFGSEAAAVAEEIRAIRAAEGAETLRVVCRPDALQRGLFVVVIMARPRFSEDLHARIEQRLLQTLNGTLLHRHVALDELELVRLHFYIGAAPETLPVVRAGDLESDLSELLRTWEDRLVDQLRREMARSLADEWAAKYLPALSAQYRAATDIAMAVRDLRCLEALAAARAPQVDISNDTVPAAARFTALKLYLLDEELVLSDFLPVLENLGLKVFEEDHLDVMLPAVGPVRIHTFLVQDTAGQRLDPEHAGGRLAQAVLALRAGRSDNDILNRLVLHAGLTWREVDLLRAYAGHAQQAGVAARGLLYEALASSPEPARLLVEGFRTKFDPAGSGAPRDRLATQLPAVEARFVSSLDAVDSAQHDRILRALWAALAATVRTNFFVPPPPADRPARAGDGTIAIKLESAQLPQLPRPHPLFEIYVHAAHMSGIHLRASRVARGGIRASDRPDDFRTEVLGLMKTQTVKNAVIVPGGAKGGFVVKRRPGSSGGALTVAAYRALIGGLLDLTDNIVQGGVVPPPQVLSYDEPDPYLVVAADKGTATFSDVANEIAAAYGFWLGDAFASGGSHGYDHKHEAITARGAWECVVQHFRALGRDADSEPLAVIGIGDMSGDVFGNGLLRSRRLRLRAAFNHRHVFLDPEPDAETAGAERERLFGLPRSGWDDYNPALISPGGGVFLRSAKKVALTPPVRAMLGVEAESLSGEELVRAVLRMEADLLWNGGIGTYVKAQDETHAEVGDPGNDAVRINANELRVKVVAEGGNLGFTQRARVEFALAGGCINTDAIDNSGGVDLSDHEVNLKIALGRALESGALAPENRNQVLAAHTAEICARVLADNRRQARVLGFDQLRSRTRLNDFRDLISLLEAEAQLDRQLERLPDREALRARRAVFLGLTRPELAVVLAYSKLHLQHALMRSALPDDQFLERFLRRYFPEDINQRYGDGVRAHRLRREIIAVTLANWLIDAMGATFVARIARDTAGDVVQVVKAWTVVVTISGADEFIDRLSAGTPVLPPAADAQCFGVLTEAMERATKWMLETQRSSLGVGELVAAFSVAVSTLQQEAGGLLSDEERWRERAALDALLSAGVAPSLAQPLVSLRRTTDLLEIHQIASDLRAPPAAVGELYYRVGGLVDLEWVRQALAALAAQATGDRWERRALAGLSEALGYARRQLARSALLADNQPGDASQCLARYAARHRDQLDQLNRLIDDLKSGPPPTLAALVVVVRELGRLGGR